MRLQTAAAGTYSGSIDVIKKTIARNGPLGLYAGVGAPLVGVTPIFAVSFWGYDVGKTLVRRATPGSNENDDLTIGQMAAAGFFSAIPTTLLTAPFERVKVLLQIQDSGSGTGKKYNGSFDVIKQLYAEGGLRSVFRGSLATLARDGPGSAAYFATYEIVKKNLSKSSENGELSVGAVMIAGGTAGLAMWTAVFPLDTIKSQLQGGGPGTTLSGVIKGTYARGGIKGFFPGLGPAMARAYPANAATFVGVELAQKFMDKLF